MKLSNILTTAAVVAILFFGPILWAIICFLTWLIFLCFGLPYSLLIGTGIWLIILLLKVCVQVCFSGID